MADVQWYHIVAPLLGGGAMGAIINSVVASVRNRKQPVGRRIESIPVFKNTFGDSSLKALITISEGEVQHHYQNLFLIDIQIVNKGNCDFESFPFGITLIEGDQVVYVDYKSQDRHHDLRVSTTVSPSSPKNEIDFVLKPFNRRDFYSLKLYTFVLEGKEKPGPIDISTTEPIRFTDMPTIGELVAQAAEAVPVFGIGPLKVTLKG